MALPDGFLTRLNDSALDVERTVFLDSLGYWAKDETLVVEVFVEFADASTYRITYADYRSLTREQKTKLKNTASSPLP